MRRVYVIGTVHEATENYGTDSLVDILNAISPDLILEELTRDFYLDNWHRRQSYDSLEDTAIDAFTSSCPTERRPYDIEGRNQYYRDTGYFEKEEGFMAGLRELYANGSVSEFHRSKLDELTNAFNLRDAFGVECPRIINSAASDAVLSYKHDVMRNVFSILSQQIEELSTYRDFIVESNQYWIRRNTVMAENVLNWAMELPETRSIVVVCGFEHRHILRKHLGKTGHQVGLSLSEYWQNTSTPI